MSAEAGTRGATPADGGVNVPGTLVWSGRLPERSYDAALRVEAGRTLALVGPNGAGKSTTLDLVAGVLRAPTARLAIGDDTLVDTERGLHVPTHRRRIAALGQDPLLFPHLRVQANVEFGLRAQGVARVEARERARSLLRDVDAARFARRYPGELSGGQAARVALARALAITPRAVLLDEPFAALDVDVAPQMRRVLGTELRRHHVPTILVTHDLLDVLALADDLAVIENGRIVECGPTSDVLRAPTSAFAASLAGVNHLIGRVAQPGVVARDDGGLGVHGVFDGDLPVGARAVAVWPPSSVALYRVAPEGSPRNVWPCDVVDLVDRGGIVRVSLAVRSAHPDGALMRMSADLSPAAVHDLALAPGTPVVASVKAQAVTLYPTG